jgi:molybdopterin-guanine dinucleotide biosynthesis protein A
MQFGFNKGYLLTDEINYLEKGNRKQVYWKTFHSVKEIDIDLLKAYIFEAVSVDEDYNRKKKKIISL